MQLQCNRNATVRIRSTSGPTLRVIKKEANGSPARRIKEDSKVFNSTNFTYEGDIRRTVVYSKGIIGRLVVERFHNLSIMFDDSQEPVSCMRDNATLI